MCALVSDTLVAVVAPLAPTAEFSRMAAGTSEGEEEEDDDFEHFKCAHQHLRVPGIIYLIPHS